jgi:hypothetical protein
MKRASYREAIAWVAENDSAGESTALELDEVGALVSAGLVADIFRVSTDKVAKDIVRYRRKTMGMS